MKKKIAVLGGRFDPPHWGHFWVAKQVLESPLAIDKLWLMPTFIHPWKKVETSAEQRFVMTNFLVNEKIEVSDLEIRRGGVSYTLETVRQLKEDRENDYYWIVGSDALSDFAKWRSSAKLGRLIPFIVFPRGDYPIKILPPGFKKIDSPDLIISNLSSSKIRERIKNSLSINGLLPEKTEKYIIKHRLYQS